MKQKAFTLLEIITVVIVAVILVAVSAKMIISVSDNAKMRACKANLKAIVSAIEIYSIENKVFPAVLSAVPFDYYEKGYYAMLKDAGMKDRLALAWTEKVLGHGTVLAQVATLSELVDSTAMDEYGLNPRVLKCPSASGAVSYGVNSDLVGVRWADITDDTIIVADCDALTFSGTNYTKRHVSSAGIAVGCYAQKDNTIECE